MTDGGTRNPDDGRVRLTVVVVTYNSAGCMTRCIQAARRSFDFSCDELVIVDNNSHDDTLGVVAAACPEAIVIRNDANVGFAAAVNQALDRRSGRHVALLNPDVQAIEGDIGRVLELLEDSSVAAVGTMLVDEQGAIQRQARTIPTPAVILAEDLALDSRVPGLQLSAEHRMMDWDMRSERDVGQACGALLFLGGDAMTRVGLLDERYFMYFEETDWLRRARDEGMRVVYTPSVRAVHEGGDSTEGSSSVGLELLLTDSMFAYVRKWNGPLAELAMRAVLVVADAARVPWAYLRGGEHRAKAELPRRRLRVDLGGRAPHGE